MRSNTAVGGITDTLTASTAAVTSLVAAVHAGALHGEGHDELSALLAEVRAVQARLEYVLLAAVREVDTRGSYVSDGALTAGAWARMHTRMTPAESDRGGAHRPGAGVRGATRHRRSTGCGVIDPPMCGSSPARRGRTGRGGRADRGRSPRRGPGRRTRGRWRR